MPDPIEPLIIFQSTGARFNNDPPQNRIRASGKSTGTATQEDFGLLLEQLHNFLSLDPETVGNIFISRLIRTLRESRLRLGPAAYLPSLQLIATDIIFL